MFVVCGFVLLRVVGLLSLYVVRRSLFVVSFTFVVSCCSLCGFVCWLFDVGAISRCLWFVVFCRMPCVSCFVIVVCCVLCVA